MRTDPRLPGRRVAGAVLAALALGGCGAATANSVDRSTAAPQGGGHGAQAGPILHGHPQAIDPVAGQAGTLTPQPAPSGPSSVSVGPAASGSPGRLAQPVSDSQVRAELAASGISANPNQATLIPGGLALAPVNAPAPVQAVLNAGNEIAHLPYVWGGGHMTYEDTGYDCSGSLSFVLAAAGLLNRTETSGELMSYGDPGPGKWITIFANAGHTFAYIAGLRFDTVALAETGSRWSNRSADEPDLKTFAVRHPPGL